VDHPSDRRIKYAWHPSSWGTCQLEYEDIKTNEVVTGACNESCTATSKARERYASTCNKPDYVYFVFYRLADLTLQVCILRRMPRSPTEGPMTSNRSSRDVPAHDISSCAASRASKVNY
jgi:hypothetical protein